MLHGLAREGQLKTLLPWKPCAVGSVGGQFARMCAHVLGQGGAKCCAELLGILYIHPWTFCCSWDQGAYGAQENKMSTWSSNPERSEALARPIHRAPTTETRDPTVCPPGGWSSELGLRSLDSVREPGPSRLTSLHLCPFFCHAGISMGEGCWQTGHCTEEPRLGHQAPKAQLIPPHLSSCPGTPVTTGVAL